MSILKLQDCDVFDHETQLIVLPVEKNTIEGGDTSIFMDRIKTKFPYALFDKYDVAVGGGKNVILKGNVTKTQKIVAIYFGNVDEFDERLRKIFKYKNLKSVVFPNIGKITNKKFEDIILKYAKKFIYVNVSICDCTTKPESDSESVSVDEISYSKGLEVLEIFKDELKDNGYHKFFDATEVKNTIKNVEKEILKEIKDGYKITPKAEDVFNALLLTSLQDLKVLIIGQDPYHTPGAAMGLAFSHPEEYTKIQPSLSNIYKEVENCGFKVNKKSGDLTSWAENGVLLINTALTVREGDNKNANSHSKMWKTFTSQFLTFVNKNVKNFVVILWGNHAQSYEDIFDKNKKILKSVHPSPMSASTGFFGNKHFLQANAQLKKWGKEEVDWNLV
jgi:uracil-DNA glycosylase